jgi:hypothetical protein
VLAAATFVGPTIAEDQETFAPPYTPPVCNPACLETLTPPNCNPIYLLEQYTLRYLTGFIAEYIPDFDRFNRQIYIVDKGDVWEVSYIEAIDAPPQKGITFGPGFPVLVVSKAECKVVKAKFYQ